MFEDYRRYLYNVRNNLIQCGIEFPINPLETPRDLFKEGIRLDEVIWLYSRLGISDSKNSIKSFFMPVTGYYKEKMRKVFYSEFTEFIKEYRKMSVTYQLLNKLSNEDEKEEIYAKDIDMEEEIDLSEGEDEVIKKVPAKDFLSTMIEEEETESGSEDDNEEDYSLDKILLNEEYSEHGIYLDDLEDNIEDFATHGIYLEDIELNSKEISYVTHGIYLDELVLPVESNKNEFASHGIYLDELSLVEESKGYALHGIYLDDLDLAKSTLSESENTAGYVSHGIYIDELELDNNSDDSSEEFYEDDERFENSAYEEFDEDSDFNEEIPAIDSPQSVNPKVQSSQSEELDLTDYLQMATNKVLTKGKRILVKELRKLKE